FAPSRWRRHHVRLGLPELWMAGRRVVREWPEVAPVEDVQERQRLCPIGDQRRGGGAPVVGAEQQRASAEAAPPADRVGELLVDVERLELIRYLGREPRIAEVNLEALPEHLVRHDVDHSRGKVGAVVEVRELKVGEVAWTEERVVGGLVARRA